VEQFLDLAMGAGGGGAVMVALWKFLNKKVDKVAESKLDKEVYIQAHEPVVEATKELKDLVQRIEDKREDLLTKEMHEHICEANQRATQLLIKDSFNQILREIRKGNGH